MLDGDLLIKHIRKHLAEALDAAGNLNGGNVGSGEILLHGEVEHILVGDLFHIDWHHLPVLGVFLLVVEVSPLPHVAVGELDSAIDMPTFGDLP
ncbi:hypothetical protein ES703_105246 [subsurface metagenome]